MSSTRSGGSPSSPVIWIEQGLAARLDGLQSLEAEYDLLFEIEQYTAEAA